MENFDWDIEVIFIGDYADLFDQNESRERESSEQIFKLALEKIIKETGTIPTVGDWINPIQDPHYSLDIGRIAGRDFYSEERKIRFEIE